MAHRMWYQHLVVFMLEHRLTKVAAFATFLLLIIGGTVNPTGSSLACPEPSILCNKHCFRRWSAASFTSTATGWRR